MVNDDAAEILRVLREVADKVTAVHGLITSVDGRLRRIEAALDRLEGPLTLDAGFEVEAGTTIH